MGLGGYLTWTAAFHEINKFTGKRCVPGERYGPHFLPKSSQIFYNNPTIVSLNFAHTDEQILVAMNDPSTNYCKSDTPSKAVHRIDKHIILQILERYGLSQVSLNDVRCRLYLDSAEVNEVDRLTAEITDPFITIEPSSNTEYTVNREYPFDKWQHVVDALCNKITIVQVGSLASQKLENVVDMRGRTTFRTAAGLIGRSRMLLSTEGGLTHAATVFDVPSLVLITGYQHPDMVAYPNNTNLWVHGDHGPCGLKQRCADCWRHVSNHDPDEIVEKVTTRLSL